MDIRRSTLLAALGQLITGPLAETSEYGYLQLSSSWRSTGLRQDDLRQALRHCVTAGYLELHGDEIEARYRITQAGRGAIGTSSWMPWVRWRDNRNLEQLQLRARLPASDAEPSRRDDDLNAALRH